MRGKRPAKFCWMLLTHIQNQLSNALHGAINRRNYQANPSGLASLCNYKILKWISQGTIFRIFFRDFFCCCCSLHPEYYEYFINSSLRILCEYTFCIISKSEIFISIFIFYFPIARGYCIVSELTVIHFIARCVCCVLYVCAGLNNKNNEHCMTMVELWRGQEILWSILGKCVV